MRRLARTGLCCLMQLGLHAAGRQARLGSGSSRWPKNTASTTPPGCLGRRKARCLRPPQIQGELDIGSTAIGQGEVLATPLEMLEVAATVADGGHRPAPSFLADRRGECHHAGRSAPRLPGPSAPDDGGRPRGHRPLGGDPRHGRGRQDWNGGTEDGLQTERRNARAAKTKTNRRAKPASAPKRRQQHRRLVHRIRPGAHPRIAVCVMLVKDGAGGDTAAPVARDGPGSGPARPPGLAGRGADQTSSSAVADSDGSSGLTILISSGRLSSETTWILNSSRAPRGGAEAAIVSATGSWPLPGTSSPPR